MRSVPRFVALSGVGFLVPILVLTATEATLGSPIFFACAAVMGAAYVAVLLRTWKEPAASRGALLLALTFALAFRAPLAAWPVDANSDMVRYLWDGRVQRFGLNPYAVVPADPAVAHTHTEQTRQMPSLRARTPYPPAAQLFFRVVTAVHESTLAIKLALVAADLLTIVIVLRWLLLTGRNPWLVLAYAWNPLVVLEIAHGGHIDALGALLIALSAWALTARRTMTASVAFVLAVATKLLPIVLVPLFWKRVRVRDVAVAALVGGALLMPFVMGRSMPVGAIPGVIQRIRFNGPVFQFVAGIAWPQFAAAFAVAAGFGAAVWCRWKLAPGHPAAWAWPMAIALVCAPVVYPWYLLYLTPFLLTRATVPLVVWTCAVIPTYIVWEIARTGGRWILPPAVMIAEYAVVLAAVVFVWVRSAAPRQHSTAESP